MDNLMQTVEAALASPVSRVRRAAGPGRQTRRLYDKVLVAFHHACDAYDMTVAEQLLAILEEMALRGRSEDGNRRRTLESLVAAHERLWHLRHPQLD